MKKSFVISGEAYPMGGDAVELRESKKSRGSVHPDENRVTVAQLRKEMQYMREALQDFIRTEISHLKMAHPTNLARLISGGGHPHTRLISGGSCQEGAPQGTICKETDIREFTTGEDEEDEVCGKREEGRRGRRLSHYPMPEFLEEKEPEVEQEVSTGLLTARCVEMQKGMMCSSSADGHGGLAEHVYGWAMSQSFEYLVLFLITVNTISIGLQTDVAARTGDQDVPGLVVIMNHAFNISFAAELVLRSFAYSSTSTFWSYLGNNALDSAVIAMLAIEEALAALRQLSASGHWHVHHELGIIRIVRILRLVRVIRSPSFLRVTSQLRAFVISIMDSVQGILWAIMLINVLTYVFAIYLTSTVTDYRKHNSDSEHEVLVHHYGSVTATMISLLVGMLNGEQWYDIALPLGQCSSWLVAVFAAYMIICILGVLNMVTGVFVTTALKHVDRDKLIVLKIQLTDIFHKSDTDKSGTLTMDELDEHLENPQLLREPQDIDLKPDDARTIFHLLDEEGVGDIDINDMVAAAVNLQGAAKALDLELVKKRQEQMHFLLISVLEQSVPHLR
eukprot:TRINITY_DN17160_c0_g1_i3.p1 TRINITY_DN17160_c0_g1~~TRINITY_DN17160_c0_g1_i3.p1  ORF type:complete len:563 (+),score=102.49 TRINITY_DN17160_c0_g1_i3:89-1777(+)